MNHQSIMTYAGRAVHFLTGTCPMWHAVHALRKYFLVFRVLTGMGW